MMTTITPLNGRLPASQLAVADTGPNGPQQLRTDAAASWDRMLADGCPAGHLRSGYRTLAQQAEQVAAAAAGRTPSALPVGQSQHGEGLAADTDEPARSWIARWGAAFGWRIGFVPREPWHAEYSPASDQHAAPTGGASTSAPASTSSTTTPEETDMYVLVSASAQRGYVLVRGDGTTHRFNANPAYTDEWATWSTNHPAVPRLVFADTPAGNRAFDIEYAVATQPTL